MIAIGAAGVISTIANGFPKAMSHIVDLARQGRHEAARTHTWSLLPLNSLINRTGNPVGTKQLLAALEICKNHVRLPLVTVPTPLVQEIQAAVFQRGIKREAYTFPNRYKIERATLLLTTFILYILNMCSDILSQHLK